MSPDERLPRGVRARLEARLAARPWPPPARTEPGDAAIATVLRLRADAHVAASRADWIVVAPASVEKELKSSLVDPEILVAGEAEWAAVAEALRLDVEGHATIVRLEILSDDDDWKALLPRPAALHVEPASRGHLVPVHARLLVPGFGTVSTLHVWSVGHDEPVLQEDVSGVLDLSALPRLA